MSGDFYSCGMDDLEAHFVSERMWLMLGDFDQTRVKARDTKIAVERLPNQANRTSNLNSSPISNNKSLRLNKLFSDL